MGLLLARAGMALLSASDRYPAGATRQLVSWLA